MFGGIQTPKISHPSEFLSEDGVPNQTPVRHPLEGVPRSPGATKGPGLVLKGCESDREGGARGLQECGVAGAGGREGGRTAGRRGDSGGVAFLTSIG